MPQCPSRRWFLEDGAKNLGVDDLKLVNRADDAQSLIVGARLVW